MNVPLDKPALLASIVWSLLDARGKAVQRFGNLERKGPLANCARASDEVRMRKPIRAQRPPQPSKRLRMANQSTHKELWNLGFKKSTSPERGAKRWEPNRK